MVYCQDNEFVCLTCKTLINIEDIDLFERTHISNFIPMQIRRTINAGFIFTSESILYNYHINHGKDHKWGKYDDMINYCKSLNKDSNS